MNPITPTTQPNQNLGGYQGTGKTGNIGSIQYNAPDTQNPYGSYNIPPTTPSNSSSATPTSTPSNNQTNNQPSTTGIPTPYTGTPDQQNTINNAQNELNSNNQSLHTAQQQFSDAVDSLSNGSMPLNAGQQAQITGLQTSYAQLIAQQQQQNTSAEGLGNIRGYQTGAAEYDPTFQAKTIGAIVTAGINKVATLNNELAGKTAELTSSFQKDDYADIKDKYDSFVALQDKRDTELQKTVDDTNKAIKDAQDRADQQQQDAIKQQQDQQDFAEKVREFNATQKEKQNEFAQTEALAEKKAGATGAGSDVPQSVIDAVTKNPALINLYSYSMKGKVLNAVLSAAAGTKSNIGSAILGSKLNFDGAETSVKDATKKLTNMTASESAATNTMQLAIGKLQDIQGNSTLLSNLSSPKARDAILNLKKDWGGNSDVVEYTNYIVDALNEYGKVIAGQTTGSGVSDAARGEAEKIINAGYNPQQLQAAFSSMQNAMSARTGGLTDSISQATIKGIGGDPNPTSANTSPTDLYSAMFPANNATPVDPSSVFNNFVPN